MGMSHAELIARILDTAHFSFCVWPHKHCLSAIFLPSSYLGNVSLEACVFLLCVELGLISFNVPTSCHPKVRKSQSLKPVSSNLLADDRLRLREVSTFSRAAQPGSSGVVLNSSL